MNQNQTAAFRKAFSNRPFVGAVLYVAFLYVFEELAFNFPQIYFFLAIRDFYLHTEMFVAVASGVGSFVICYLFVWTALRSPALFQVFYIFLLGISSLVQYGFWKAVQRFMVPVDLTIAAATTLDTWKGAGVLYFSWYSIVPIIVFIAILFSFSQRQELKTGFMKFGVLLLLTVLLSVSHRFLIGRELNLGLSLSSFYQTLSRFTIDSMLPAKREKISYKRPDMPHNNIILIIDESIRGDHLGVNGYERDTTPFLNALAKSGNDIHNFGLAVSGGTCSAASNALIITGVRPGLDEFKKTAEYPTVFQYAKAMGYKTYFIDVQASVLWNGLTTRDLPFIDSWIKADEFGNNSESDFHAADLVTQIVSEGSGNFIVLNKRGVHFLYRHSYPQEAAVWLPIPGDHVGDPVLVSNPYDNAILYNVNTFFERLLGNPTILENTIILYTSDHGQTLFANGANWLHCKNSREETIVPLIMIGRNLPAAGEKHHASHSNILPTLLDLMGVPLDDRAHQYAPSLLFGTNDMNTDRYFFDGSLQLLEFPDSYMEAFE